MFAHSYNAHLPYNFHTIISLKTMFPVRNLQPPEAFGRPIEDAVIGTMHTHH